MPRDQLEALQLSRLKSLLARVYENVPTYRKKFDEAGFDPASVERAGAPIYGGAWAYWMDVAQGLIQR